MKILQVNGYESPGRRFNGLAITPLLQEHDIQSQHLVWIKDTNNPDVLNFNRQGGNRWLRRIYNLGNRLINLAITQIERIASLQSVLYPYAWQIINMQAFREADVLHLHIIHSGFMSFSALPKLTALKPTVWTLHDPWAMTGHCIHPLDCERWKAGCGQCPALKAPMPLLFDTTRWLFNYKLKAYKKSKFAVIVASQWMRNMVEKSPLMDGVQIHHIPFGLDLYYWNSAAAPNAKARFGISANTLVICFRAADNAFKGLPYIIQVLERISSKQPICLITMEKKGLLQQFQDKFQLVELGWTNDEQRIRDAFVSTDIFLMPSIAEAFGMMAVEAMACGKPVISFEGTSLPEVTFAPDVGVSVPMKDTEALYQALQRLIDNPTEREERGKKARLMAEQHYSDELQAQRLAKVYEKVRAEC
jgi:glycosyltransferase involved in cell wall biosynthesis